MIEFDGSLYRMEAVLKAARDYHEIADITVKKHGKYIICDIIKPKTDLRTVEKELGNYVLNLTVMAERESGL